MTSPAKLSRVTIRMYRLGLGDCFLLGFHLDDGTARWALIDCGVVEHEGAAEQTRKVAADIAEATKDAGNPNGLLHRVVVSNMHSDHVSGFVHAADIFGRMTIEEVWLPASEDAGDERTRRRAAARRQRLKDLYGLGRDLKNSSEETARALSSVLRLLGGDAGDSACEEGESIVGDAALAFLSEKTGARVRYLDTRAAPQPLFAEVPDVRVYVLGPAPPRDVRQGRAAAALGALSLEDSFLAAAQSQLGMSPQSKANWDEKKERGQPFPVNHRVTFANAAQEGGASQTFTPPTYAEFYQQMYFAGGSDWRRIDNDWMTVGRSLTLTLNREVNNAGLALAFELAESGKVLLFPGDAQLGAWRSWDALAWTLREGGDKQEVTARDLLRRAVVYKVSHRCSETGTPIEQGLEYMEHRDLVALLPFDQTTARSLGWDLPYAPLLSRLREKAKGRVVISGTHQPPQADSPKPDALTESEWLAFRKSVREEPLYSEYTLEA